MCMYKRETEENGTEYKEVILTRLSSLSRTVFKK